MLRRSAITTVFALLLSLSVAAPGFAATAKSVLEKARDKYEGRLKSVNSVTIVREMMGREIEHTMRKEMVDGHPQLVAEGADAGANFGSLFQYVDQIAAQAELQGKKEIDGHECWVIYVPRISEIDVAAGGPGGFDPKDGRLYVDTKESLLRGMQMNGAMTENGHTETMTMDIVLTDFREIDGWIQPFRTEMSMSGEAGGSRMAEMEAAMAEMEKKLQEMPAEQRAMMEKMMKDKMPKMSGGDGGGAKMSMAIEVKDVRVNDAE